MPPHGHCQICLGYYAVSEFQLLPCGHGCCKSCHGYLFDGTTTKGKCFLCRKEFNRESVLRVHLELVDSKVAILASTVEGLEKMDAAAKAISVTRASSRIQRTAQELECDNERAASLQQAIDDFQSRIVPLFSQVEAQAKELAELRLKLSHAEGKAKAFEVVCEESRKKDERIVVFVSKLSEMKQDRDHAVSLAEKMVKDHAADREEKERLKEETEVLERDKRRLYSLLEQHQEAAKSKRTKYRELKMEVALLKERNQTWVELDSQSVALDESLSDDHVDENFPSSSSPVHRRRKSPIRNTPRRSSGLSQITNELLSDVDLDCDGMANPGFSSDWKMSVAPKRKATNFPIPLDKRGRPTHPVQIGPIRSRRVP